MVRVKGFEPLTAWFVARYSIQLSYTRIDVLTLVGIILTSSKNTKTYLRKFIKNGAGEGIRTPDRLVRSQVLYPAELHPPRYSYVFIQFLSSPSFRANRKMVRVKGFEPLTAWFVARYSIQLSYTRFKNLQEWRWRRDSNPRTGYKPVTPLAGERLRPLGHPTVVLLAHILLSSENKSNTF